MKEELSQIKALAKESKRARAKLEKAVNAFFADRAELSDNGVVRIKATRVEDHDGDEVALADRADMDTYGEVRFYDEDDQERIYPFYQRVIDDDSLVRLVRNIS